MGGGGAMRAAAKAAGMGVFTGGIRSAAVADTFAARKTVRPASAGGVSDLTGGLKVESTGNRSVWEVDEWEFAGGSEDDLIVDRVGPAKPTRMVFGPVPSLEEAKEATSELKEALEKYF